MGERTPAALLDYAASARMAVGEAITNIAATNISDVSQIVLSANWMAAAGHPGEDAGLYEAVKAVGMELCPQLGIAIPVGKDSMSMKTVWQDHGENKAVTAPLSLIISAFAPVQDVRKTLTPQLQPQSGPSCLLLLDLGQGKNRIGASALAQVYNEIGEQPADLDDAQLLRGFFAAVQVLQQQNYIHAYHDRSDGGLFVTLCEMAFAAYTGLTVDISGLGADAARILFSEELGAVIQVPEQHLKAVLNIIDAEGLGACTHNIATLRDDDRMVIHHNNEQIFSENH